MMQRYLRLAFAAVLITAMVGALQFGWTGGAAGAGPERPRFDSLTPAPYTTVEPGPVLVGAHAFGNSALTDVRLLLNGAQVEQIGSQSETYLAISAQRVLPAGVYTATVIAIDAEGQQFQAQWDFIVSDNPADGEWFNAEGQPVASQINATMKSLVEAFRWHLYGLSWDGSSHPDLPSHVGLTGTGDAVGPWVTGTTFDQSDTEATLRSLVEAFRWHFWGISWDGNNHPDIPTHAGSVQPPQGIDPWFSDTGQPIPANITATLRSLVEAFRWHFWGYSWDGSHHPDIPTHAGMNQTNPTPSPSPSPSPSTYPAEGSVLYQSSLTSVPPFTGSTGSTGAPTANGYKLTMPANGFDGISNRSTTFGDASYSLSMRTISPSGDSAGCLVYRDTETSTSSQTYMYCLVFSGNIVMGSQAFYLAVSTTSTTPVADELAHYTLPSAHASTDWNSIKVIAKGNHFWFFADGAYLGTATYSGTNSGYVGFSMYNLDETNTQSMEFTGLTVRTLQSSGSSAAADASLGVHTQSRQLPADLLEAAANALR